MRLRPQHLILLLAALAAAWALGPSLVNAEEPDADSWAAFERAKAVCASSGQPFQADVETGVLIDCSLYVEEGDGSTETETEYEFNTYEVSTQFSFVRDDDVLCEIPADLAPGTKVSVSLTVGDDGWWSACEVTVRAARLAKAKMPPLRFSQAPGHADSTGILTVADSEVRP